MAVNLYHVRNISREERNIEIANNVSTELFLSIDPDIWKIKKRPTKSDVGSLTRNIEIANNELTELSVSIDPDIWKSKKRLTKSDVGSLSRLLIPKESVNEHILKHLTNEEITRIEDFEHVGFKITVFDSDTSSTHQLCLKRWHSTGSYILNDSWNKDFVQRKELKPNNEIGLFWNSYASRLHLRVLDRS